MLSRPYDPERDCEAVRRIWRECGWIADDFALVDTGLAACRNVVAELDGEAECVVHAAPGSLRYLDGDVPISLVAGVATSVVARRQGLASALTAQVVAEDAAQGAVLSALGMFDQGFYDRLGFGTGSYTRLVEFDPARLRLPAGVRPRPPRRLGLDDYEAVHASRLARRRTHGMCNVLPPGFSHSEMLRGPGSFGLGYADGADGSITHHLWFRPDNVERGPYRVLWMAWRTREELLELLGLLRGLGDQVEHVRVAEPAGVQLQAFLDRPFRALRTTRQSSQEQRCRSFAWWQMRIDDVPRAMEAVHVPGRTPRFVARLRDPIADRLPADAPWRGVAGDWVIELGGTSSAKRGTDPSLPVLDASINAFTRLWLGVAPASGLAITDDLRAPRDLLAALDEAWRLPEPQPDWEF
jgi:hypothetical protein